jgi:hypothetical protein
VALLAAKPGVMGQATGGAFCSVLLLARLLLGAQAVMAHCCHVRVRWHAQVRPLLVHELPLAQGLGCDQASAGAGHLRGHARVRASI